MALSLAAVFSEARVMAAVDQLRCQLRCLHGDVLGQESWPRENVAFFDAR